MTQSPSLLAVLTFGLGSLLGGTAIAQDIPIAAGVHPENIASAADGSLLISSITQGIVYRVAPGATSAEPWITDIGPAVTGVFALEDSVYVCSNGPFGANEPAFFKVYDLSTGEETA